MEEVYNTVVGINSIATIHKSSYSKVDLDSVLDIGAYNLSNVEKFNSSTDFVRCQPCLPTVSSVPSKRNILQFKDIQRNDNDHIKNDIQTKSLSIAGKFNRKKLEVVLDELLFSDVDSNSSHEKNDRKLEEVSSLTNEDLPMIIYRLKAIIHTDSSTNLCIVQAVHNIFDVKVSSFVSGGKGDTTNGNNPFVIIGKNINLTLVEERLRTCLI